MQVPLDLKLKSLPDIPYTISYVIRKRQQVDSYRELPSTHQPPDYMIWDSTTEELDEFFDKVMHKKEDRTIKLDLSNVEG